MTLPMARDLSTYGIRVMCIAPGLIETPMTAPMSKAVRESILSQVIFSFQNIIFLDSPISLNFVQMCVLVLSNS